MMRKLLLLLLLISVSSCYKGQYQEEQKKVDSLTTENLQLKQRITELEWLEEERNRTKFVWTVIHHKRGAYVSGWSSSKGHYSGFEGNISDYIVYSEVEKVNGYSEDLKYKLQDDLEKSLRSKFSTAVHSIQKRETFVFDSYEAASQHRFSYIN